MISELEQATPYRKAHVLRALRHRNYRLLWLGQGVSQTGAWMQVVAQSWLAYRLTDSPLMLGLVNVVGLLPVVPVALWAGLVSDRLPRRALLLGTEVALLMHALAMAVLTWSGAIRAWHIMALSFVLGAAVAIEQPVRLALVADAVGKEDVANAVALSAAANNSARIVGPALAGLVVAWVGEAGCFALNALSCLAVVGAVLRMHLPHRAPPAARLRMGHDALAGFRYIWGAREIRALIAIVAVSSFLTLPYVALLPVYARDVLGTGAQGLGFLMTAIGVGAVLGSMGVAAIPRGRRGLWLTLGNVGGPVLLILCCLATRLSVSLGLVLLLGAGNALRQTLAAGLIQQLAADEFHGRVVSVYNLLFSGMSRLGALGVGALAEVSGVTWALSLAALVSLAWGLGIIWRMPYVHRLP